MFKECRLYPERVNEYPSYAKFEESDPEFENLLVEKQGKGYALVSLWIAKHAKE